MALATSSFFGIWIRHGSDDVAELTGEVEGANELLEELGGAMEVVELLSGSGDGAVGVGELGSEGAEGGDRRLEAGECGGDVVEGGELS